MALFCALGENGAIVGKCEGRRGSNGQTHMPVVAHARLSPDESRHSFRV
jgi:hypothetical protein